MNLSHLFGAAMLLMVSGRIMACPDFTGTYVGKFKETDFRSKVVLTWNQEGGCEKVKIAKQVFLRNGTENKVVNFEFPLKSYDAGNSYGWQDDSIAYLKKNVNSEGCNLHGVWKPDTSKNLFYRWRLECPDENSNWRPAPVLGGIYYHQANP